MRKGTLIIFMSVCPSVRREQLGSHYTDFDEIWCLSFGRKSVKKIQVSLKSDNNNGYFTRRRFHICDNISLNSLIMRNVSNKSCRENRHTRFFVGNYFPENVGVNDMNVEKFGGAREAADDNMAALYAGYIRLHTRKHTSMHPYSHTHKYVILIAFPRQQVLWTRLSVTLYVHCLFSYVVHLLLCGRWRTQQSWRTDLLCTWGVKRSVFGLFRPPIRYRCLYKRLAPCLPLGSSTGQNPTDVLVT